MIKTVTVINYLGDELVLDLFNPKPSGFAIRSITGLGPVKATVNTTEIPTGDGSLYNSARLNQRNIVMSLGFDWIPLIEDARHKTYKYFPLKKNLTLVFETDRRTVYTEGYVESNEPDIFSNAEGCQISVICPDPGFYPYGPGGITQTPFYTITPLFEFPFENESLTEPTLEFGLIDYNIVRSIWYDGDEEVGIRLIIHAYGPVSNITFRNVNTREYVFFDTYKLQRLTGQGMIAGDEIIISSVRGEKGATLIRNGVTSNVLNCLNRDSDWFKLSKGENVFAYNAEEGRDNVKITVENQVIYAGV